MTVSNSAKIDEKIINAYHALDVNQIKKIFKNKKSHFVVDTLNQVSDANAIIFCIIIMQKDNQLHLINSINYDLQEQILEIASDSQLKIILKNLYIDEIVNLMDNHIEFKKKIYLNVDKEKRKEIHTLSSYDENEIGRIMNPEPLYIIDNWSIKKAINYIRQEYKELEITSTIFVVDEEKKLLGIVTIHDLFFAPKINTKISLIMNKDFYQISATDDVEDVINLFDKYSLSSVPVVDSKNNLLGFVRNTDINAITQDEVTEDIYKLYGITELKDPYLHASIWNIVKSRLLWLTILMIASTLTSILLQQFEVLGNDLTAGLSTILLVPLIPVLSGASGNAGSQSAASVIRSLSIGEITKKEYLKAILKELKVGLLVGLILAIINFARLLIYNVATYKMIDWSTTEYKNLAFNEIYTKLTIIAVATSVTLFITITLSKLLGCVLPIIATKFKKDPAVMSAPILATILDILTTTLLFGIGIGIIHLIQI